MICADADAHGELSTSFNIFSSSSFATPQSSIILTFFSLGDLAKISFTKSNSGLQAGDISNLQFDQMVQPNIRILLPFQPKFHKRMGRDDLSIFLVSVFFGIRIKINRIKDRITLFTCSLTA